MRLVTVAFINIGVAIFTNNMDKTNGYLIEENTFYLPEGLLTTKWPLKGSGVSQFPPLPWFNFLKGPFLYRSCPRNNSCCYLRNVTFFSIFYKLQSFHLLFSNILEPMWGTTDVLKIEHSTVTYSQHIDQSWLFVLTGRTTLMCG